MRIVIKYLHGLKKNGVSLEVDITDRVEAVKAMFEAK